MHFCRVNFFKSTKVDLPFKVGFNASLGSEIISKLFNYTPILTKIYVEVLLDKLTRVFKITCSSGCSFR